MNENGRPAPWMTITGNVISSGEISPIYIDGEEAYLDEEYQPMVALRPGYIAEDTLYNWGLKADNGVWRLYFGDAGYEEPNDFPIVDTKEMDEFFDSLKGGIADENCTARI